MPTLDRIAKTIVGPNEAHNVGQAKLLELQDTKFGRLKSQEQAHFIRAAKFVLALFDSEPDGWVITSGDDKRARCWDDSSAGLAVYGPGWTNNLDRALWFARRDDAERFAADDEDAWYVRRVSDVRRMWAAPPASEGAPSPQQPSTQRVAAEDPAIMQGPAPTPVAGPVRPTDQRSTEHLLFLLRAYIANAPWPLTHHHPIWQDVAEELDQFDLNYYPTEGPDYAFVQPDNRKSHSTLLEEYVDMTNAHKAEARGG